MEDRAVSRQPMRTCIGCRVRAEKSELLRVVAVGSGPASVLVPDPGGRLPGRGAYVHVRPGCLDLAERRRAFSRALRRAGPLDAGSVRRVIDEAGGRSGDPERPTGQEEGDTT